jgi:8-amino-7-oxononanoate synthase
VPAGTARLRITFTAAHEPQDVDRLIEALATALHAVPERDA